MIPLSPGGGAMPQPPPSSGRQVLIRPSPVRPAVPHPFSGQMLLTLQIASRRVRLAALEAEMNAACEAAALGARFRPHAALERAHWNRTTWRRYLAAAMRLEASYGPRMRRLHREIARLERLMTLLITA